MESPQHQLEKTGINLWFGFHLKSLPADLHRAITASHPNVDQFESLILLGSRGTRYWHQLIPLQEDDPHPVDEFVIEQIEKAFAGLQIRILYPGDHSLPLADLGGLAGWHHRSPLGLGIHPEHGLWYAYRAVVLVSGIETSTALATLGDHPCMSCTGQPCIPACPTGAVNPDGFDVKACSDYRLRENSPCKSQCLSRLACPVGTSQRYDRDQMEYHYQYSLTAIKRFRSQPANL